MFLEPGFYGGMPLKETQPGEDMHHPPRKVAQGVSILPFINLFIFSMLIPLYFLLSTITKRREHVHV